MNPEDEFQAKLQASKDKYVLGLPARITEIKFVWNQLLNVEWRLELLQKMKLLVHNLAGSGGTFGFPKLSALAHTLEKQLGELEQLHEQRPSSEAQYKIGDMLIALQETELETIVQTGATQVPFNKSDLIYILDSDKDYALNLARQLMFYGCNVKILNDINSLAKSLHPESPLAIIIELDFAQLMLGKRTVIDTIRKDWVITCPIIFISSHDSFESRILAMRLGGSAYFTKPADISLLKERIHILTNKSNLEPYRVLLIEDDAELANYYALILERGGIKCTIVTKPEISLNMIAQQNPELVVMDLYMPNYNGIEMIKVIRQHQSFFTLPIILLTGEKDVDTQFLAREGGVDDFLQKPITEQHLYDSVLNRVQRARYTNLSMSKDSLTGLYVHKKIPEYLELQLNICKRYKRTVSYCIIDIDDFKKVNDTYGHLAGDNVLITLSNLFKTTFRNTDFIGRYGGEEFVIIQPETDAQSAHITLERARIEFAKIAQYAGDKTFYVTFSAGIACYPDFTDLDEIMCVADRALYDAKIQGKNRITIATGSEI